MSALDDKLDLIEKYPSAVREAIMLAGDELVDVVGTVHSNQARIREIKRHAASELINGDTGKRWRMEQNPIAKRTYNDSALLTKLSGDGSIVETLTLLLQLDVIRISWQHQKLMKLIREKGVDVSIAQHEIFDGDKFDIGEVWGLNYASYKPVETESSETQVSSDL